MKAGDSGGGGAERREGLRGRAITWRCIIKSKMECRAAEQALQCQTKAGVRLRERSRRNEARETKRKTKTD